MHSSITINQLVRYFEVAALVEGATKAKCRSAFKQLVSKFGDICASKLTVPMIGEYQLHMRSQGLSVASIRSYFGSASQVYSWGTENNLVS